MAETKLNARQTHGTFADDGSELTIATGAVTISGHGFYRIDTEADAAADDLDTISGAVNGQIVVLRQENAARVVTMKHNTGNLQLPDSTDLTLSAGQYYMFRYDGTNWYMVGSAGGGGGGGNLEITLTNKSGSLVAQGAVVVWDPDNDEAFTTTTQEAAPQFIAGS